MSAGAVIQTQTKTRPTITPAAHGLLQRCTATQECTECRKKRLGTLQRAAVNTSPVNEVPPIVHEVLRTPGQPLDAQTRAFFEPRFGHDFSQVRVHTDAKAAESARALNALAYTVRQNVVFGSDQYTPEKRAGQHLLAHELIHTVQQRQAVCPDGEGTLALGPRSDLFEREADQMANGMSESWHLESSVPPAPASHISTTGGAPVVQRDVAGAFIGGGFSPVAGPIVGGAPSATTTGLPRVTISNFRISGTTHAENNCGLCPLPLGILAGSGKNRMELRGDLSGHRTGAQYDFKRTKERATWKLVDGRWEQMTHVGPGTDDDSHDQDESLTPINNHIYVEDGPGFSRLDNPFGDPNTTEAVYKASFIEYVNVRVGSGSWTKNSNEFRWHSITWFEKVGGGWRRKLGANEIGSGSIFVGTETPYGLGDFPLPSESTRFA